MESRAKLAGHPIHPMLIVFPLGLLATAVVFDVIHLAAGVPALAVASFWMIAAGIVGGLAAALFGLIDWLAIPQRTRARAIGLWHGLGNVVVVGLFAAAWLIRLGDAPAYSPAGMPIALQLLAAGIAVVTGWIGGELVYRLGVGVDRGAHLDSPNALSGRPAEEGRPRQVA